MTAVGDWSGEMQGNLPCGSPVVLTLYGHLQWQWAKHVSPFKAAVTHAK